MPKGGASSLTPVYAGLQEDLDTFLRAFLKIKSIRFYDYKKLFCYRGMTQLFNGRSNSAEIIEFNEYLLVYCLSYMEEFVCPGTPRSIEERLFGLYSLYTFFYLQAVNHVVKIRMDPDASRNFRKLTQLLLEEQIYDAYMCCLKLLEDKTIKLVAFIPIYDPSCFKRFYTDNSVTGVSIQTNVNDPLSKVKSIVEGSVLTSVSVIHTEYSKLKANVKVTPIPGWDNPDPQQTAKDILEMSLKDVEIRNGVDILINSDHTTAQLGSHGMIRAEIKEKAYGAELNLARFRRHRTSTPLQISTESFEFAKNSDIAVKDEDYDDKQRETGPITRQMARAQRKRGRKGGKRGRKAKKVQDAPEDKKEELGPITRQMARSLKNQKAKEAEIVKEQLDVVEKEEEENPEPAHKKQKKQEEKVPCSSEMHPESPNHETQDLFIIDDSSDDDDVTTLMPPGVTLKTHMAEKEKREQQQQQEEQEEDKADKLRECPEEKGKVEMEDIIEIPMDIEYVKTVKTPIPPSKSTKSKTGGQSTHEDPDSQEISVIAFTPKPIMKSNGKKVKRHVSFAENASGEVNTTIHEITPRVSPARGNSYNDLADDEREEFEIRVSEQLIGASMKKGQTPEKDPELNESMEKETDLEHNMASRTKNDSKFDDLEPEEPASDVVYMFDDRDIFAPLDNEDEMRAAEEDDGFEISSESESDSENELYIDE